MRFASLGSGSRGNGTVVQAGETTLLIDCGFGLRDAAARLARLGLHPSDLCYIVVTHEHGDHASGVFPLARRYGLPVWLSGGSRVALARYMTDDVAVTELEPNAAIEIGSLEVTPFPVPHDAREPLQYAFSDGASRLGVLTDIGATTPHVAQRMSGCDALVLECNHDLDMLGSGPYPAMLKERIAGRFGHLDNSSAARLLAEIDTSRLKHLVAAHLSEVNNTPALARSALAEALGCKADWVGVADQTMGFDWRGC